MIIIINNWKKKLMNLLTALVLIIAFLIAVPFVVGTLYDKIPVMSTWFQDEHPTGNPMRVDSNKKNTKFDNMLDSMVIHLQEFYYEE